MEFHSAMKKLPSIAIIYHFVPHYRIGFVNALKRSMEFCDYRWFAGINSKDGIPAVPVDCMGNFTPLRNIWIGGILIQPRVIGVALEAKYDCYVFLSNPNFLSTWVGAFLLRLRGKHVIFWGHGFFSSNRSIKNRVRKIFFRLANATFLYGYRAKQQASQLGFDKSVTHVGFNSLNYEAQLPLRLELDSSPGRVFESNSKMGGVVRVVAISRLTAICEYDVLLRAVNIAQKKSEYRFKVVFVGDGPERQRLEQLSVDLGIDTEFMGAVYDEHRTARIIYDADVVAQPGKIGLTAMHALMFGTPVISHSSFELQMPEVEALVEGVTGLLHRKADAEDLARCLIEFPIQFSDRERTRRNCYRVMDEVYNPDHQIEVLARAVKRLEAVEGDLMRNIFKNP